MTSGSAVKLDENSNQGGAQPMHGTFGLNGIDPMNGGGESVHRRGAGSRKNRAVPIRSVLGGPR